MKKLIVAGGLLCMTVLTRSDGEIKKCPTNERYRASFKNISNVNDVSLDYTYKRAADGKSFTRHIAVRKNALANVRFSNGDYLVSVDAPFVKPKASLGCINQTFVYSYSTGGVFKKGGYKLSVKKK